MPSPKGPRLNRAIFRAALRADEEEAPAEKRPPHESLDGDTLGLVQSLGFVAWSDDRLAPEERELLCNVMDSLGIPKSKRDRLCRSIQSVRPSLEEIKRAFTDDTERRFAIAQAILMARSDGEVVAEEKRDISALAQALGIGDDELQMIYAAVDLTGELTAPLKDEMGRELPL
ncbi:MAG: hypothetical protein AAGA56_23950 [Myxococcota bacterium]